MENVPPVMDIYSSVEQDEKLLLNEFLQFDKFWVILRVLRNGIWNLNCLPEHNHFHSRVIHNQDPLA